MKFKQLHFKTLLVAAGLLAGVSAGAQDTYETVYSRADVSNWAEADLTDWNAASGVTIDATNGIGANANQTATYLSKSFTIGEKNKVKYEVDWTFATATGRTGNWNWIQFGDFLRIAINSTYDMQVSTDAGSTWNATTLGNYYNNTYKTHIEVIFDTQLNQVESFIFDGTDRTSLVSGNFSNAVFNTVSTGFVRGGSVGWTLNNYLTTITVSQAEQEAAEEATYTINYKYNDKVIKTDEGTSVVGATIEAENTITIDNVKYFAVDDATLSIVLVAGANTLDVDLRQANNFSYTVKAVDSNNNVLQVLKEGTVVEGNVSVFSYPRYVNVDGTLYQRAATNNEYRQSVEVSEDGQIVSFIYNMTDIANVVYYSEAENVDGATATSAGNNMATRSSNAQCGYATEDITLATLEPGIYQATIVVYSNSSAGATMKFQFGDTSYDATVSAASNWSQSTKEFTLISAADVKWLASGDSKNGVDLIYIQKTGDIPTVPASITDAGWATLYTDQAIEFGTEVEAYTAALNGDKVVLTKVQDVPAGTGVVLKGAEGDYSFNVIASSETAKGDLKGSTTKDTPIEDYDGYNIYILSMNGNEAQFRRAGSGSVPAGKAYLMVASSEARLSVEFGDATGISAVSSETTAQGFFDLQGRRIAQPTKGLYIVNGKKVVIK